MYSSTPNYHGTLGTILKVLIGVGIFVVTIAMIFLFADVLSFSNSWFLQLMVAGVVILVMSFLSLKIFERM